MNMQFSFFFYQQNQLNDGKKESDLTKSDRNLKPCESEAITRIKNLEGTSAYSFQKVSYETFL